MNVFDFYVYGEFVVFEFYIFEVMGNEVYQFVGVCIWFGVWMVVIIGCIYEYWVFFFIQQFVDWQVCGFVFDVLKCDVDVVDCCYDLWLCVVWQWCDDVVLCGDCIGMWVGQCEQCILDFGVSMWIYFVCYFVQVFDLFVYFGYGIGMDLFDV